MVKSQQIKTESKTKESENKSEKKNDLPIKQGDKVAVHYTGRLDENIDGKTQKAVFDTSVGHEPIEFTVGSHEVIKGFEEAVIGMKVGEKKTIKIMPEEAYGPKIDKLIVPVPRSTIKLDARLEPGMRIEMTLPDGTSRIITITKIDGEAVTIDLNHPLAGKTLEFEIEIV